MGSVSKGERCYLCDMNITAGQATLDCQEQRRACQEKPLTEVKLCVLSSEYMPKSYEAVTYLAASLAARRNALNRRGYGYRVFP
jgi:hypothetical protein